MVESGKMESPEDTSLPGLPQRIHSQFFPVHFKGHKADLQDPKL